MSQPSNPDLNDKVAVTVAPEAPSPFKILPAYKRGELWSYFGPAFVASIAYIDPGNFATNIQGGTDFGYELLWVLLWSNAMAILVQYLSAKLGSRPGLRCRRIAGYIFRAPSRFGLWVAAELAAVATDLAEFLGAALGFYLLFHINMCCGPADRLSRLPDPCHRALWFSVARASHHAVCLRHRRLLRDRNVPGEAGVGTGGNRGPGSAN